MNLPDSPADSVYSSIGSPRIPIRLGLTCNRTYVPFEFVFLLVSGLAYCSTLNMDSICPSEYAGSLRTIGRYNIQDEACNLTMYSVYYPIDYVLFKIKTVVETFSLSDWHSRVQY